MKVSLYILVLIALFGFLPCMRQKKTIENLYLGYNEVMRCDCFFAKNNDKYWNKEYFYARDKVGKYGLIRLGGNKEKTKIPIRAARSAKRKKGDAWQEVYANDSLLVVLKATPIKKLISDSYSYNVKFEMVWKGDTIKENIIGHCKY